MGGIDWRKVLEMRGIDPDTFKLDFEEKLMQTDIIEDLLNLAAFQVIYHNVQDCDDGNCSECYSGDTEFEMTHDCLSLRDVWQETYDEIMEDLYDDSGDGGEDSESSEPAVIVKKI